MIQDIPLTIAFLAGILIAIFYRHEGPKAKKYQWEIDEELENKELEDLIN